jgi:hypothetical protein
MKHLMISEVNFFRNCIVATKTESVSGPAWPNREKFYREKFYREDIVKAAKTRARLVETATTLPKYLLPNSHAEERQNELPVVDDSFAPPLRGSAANPAPKP